MHGFYDWGLFSGGGFMFLFWILLIIAIIWLVFSSKNRNNSPTETALDIAKKRYAAGEITKEELDEIKRNL
ncbi:electron transporter RnfE [Vibrio albus]|uniref:Electron transporter RnfE n=1 Tax=Vibrio albus TaxID=2200953 RepID=A0A2U3B8V0_9VIBR|nr:SHOCT domain-containing protein [Vibrio albus]PWI33201.1 electron transporter RnfE [Vibrio albus]